MGNSNIQSAAAQVGGTPHGLVFAGASAQEQHGLAEMLKAMRQMGIPPVPTPQNFDPPTPSNIAARFAETAKWHKAAIEVFEFMQAQINMDLFAKNPEAKLIYHRIMLAGYHALHNEAGK